MSFKKVPILEDFSWQLPVKDKDLSTPPGSPTKGDRYLILTGAVSTGWEGQDNKIGLFNGSDWEYILPTEGMICWVDDENDYYKYTGSAWEKYLGQQGPTGPQGIPGPTGPSGGGTGPSADANHLTQNIQTLTDGASISWDMNNGGFAIVTLAGNRALANPTNYVAGGLYRLIVKQDGTGSRTLTFGNQFKFPGAVVPVLTSTASAVDIFEFLAETTSVLRCINFISDSK